MSRIEHRIARIAAVVAALIVSITMPAGAQAMTIAAPTQGQHFTHLELHPTIVVRPDAGETPKWAIVATDAGFASGTQVRYCRNWAMQLRADYSGLDWTCVGLAKGTDIFGGDVIEGLDPGTVYYLKIVFTDSTGSEKSTDPLGFVIDKAPKETDPAATLLKISTALENGGQLNAGAAAYAQSGLRVTHLRSIRVRGNVHRISVAYFGKIDVAGSYVLIRGPRGTTRHKLYRSGAWGLVAYWKRPGNRDAMNPNGARYTYQAVLTSARNGAHVRSEASVMLFPNGRASRRRPVVVTRRP